MRGAVVVSRFLQTHLRTADNAGSPVRVRDHSPNASGSRVPHCGVQLRKLLLADFIR